MLRLTRKQVREIDRRAVEEYGIPGVVLMENAARAAVEVALQILAEPPGDVLVLCGGGNNGGDGLAVARHLHNRGFKVSIVLTADPEKFQNEALANWKIVQKMRLAARPVDVAELAVARPSLVVDAIFGTGLSEAPRAPFAEIVKAVQKTGAAVLAIDLPSGMDCDTGKPLGACIRASRTITFVAEKIGFAKPEAEEYLGKITVGDIGCPRELVQSVSKLVMK